MHIWKWSILSMRKFDLFFLYLAQRSSHIPLFFLFADLVQNSVAWFSGIMSPKSGIKLHTSKIWHVLSKSAFFCCAKTGQHKIQRRLWDMRPKFTRRRKSKCLENFCVLTCSGYLFFLTTFILKENVLTRIRFKIDGSGHFRRSDNTINAMPKVLIGQWVRAQIFQRLI